MSYIVISHLVKHTIGDFINDIDWDLDAMTIHDDPEWWTKKIANFSLTGRMYNGMNWLKERVLTRKYTDAMVEIRDLLLAYAEANDLDWGTMNYCIANLYRDGNDYIDWHVDHTRQRQVETKPIVNVSLGDSRIIEWRKIGEEKLEGGYLMESGDVLVMYPEFQTLYEHKVPTVIGKNNRISLTFRSY